MRRGNVSPNQTDPLPWILATLCASAPHGKHHASTPAGVAKRQTRVAQNHVRATSCRFKSDLRHSHSAAPPQRGRLLAYVVGVALGDGNLSNPNGRVTRLRVTCDARYPRLAQKIARAVRTLLPRNRVAFVAKRGQCYDISCYSNHWEPLLGWRVGQGTKISQGVSIPCWIKERHEYAVACLRGLLETDGSMYVDRGYPMVMFVNACEPLARDVAQLMTSLDFAPRTSVIASKRPRPVFHVRLSKHVADFLQLVRPMKGARAGAFPGGSRVP